MLFGTQPASGTPTESGFVCSPFSGWNPHPPPLAALPPAQAERCSIGHIRRLAHFSPVDSLLFTVCGASTGWLPPVRSLVGCVHTRVPVRCVQLVRGGGRSGRGAVPLGGLMLAGGTGEVALQEAPGVRPSSL